MYKDYDCIIIYLVIVHLHLLLQMKLKLKRENFSPKLKILHAI